MISNKTVELLTAFRELCEEVADGAIDEDTAEAMLVAAERLDVMTDIMSYLMAANAMEKRAIAAKDCNGFQNSAEEMIFGIMNKETTN